MMLTKRDGLRQKPDPSLNTNPEQFFAQAFDAFLNARKNAIEFTYRIGGFVVRVSFANDALIPVLTPALSHLRIEASEPALKIHVWDSATTGMKIPPPFWVMKEIPSRGEIPGFAEAGMFAAFQVDGNVVSMLNQSDSAIYWTRDPRELPSYERGSPLKNILHWWMSRRGRVFVHAGAVGIGAYPFLFVGGRSPCPPNFVGVGLRAYPSKVDIPAQSDSGFSHVVLIMQHISVISIEKATQCYTDAI
jgi:hypothetical protein